MRRRLGKFPFELCAALALAGCTSLGVCAPVDGRVGFFSRGDCVLVRSTFFSGHEWITFLANDQLPAELRFSDTEIGHIVEGNRRVDYPKELLVHLAAGVTFYISALQAYHDRPEKQRLHFLLDARSTTAEAAAVAKAHMRALLHRALPLWSAERTHALTLIGQLVHTLQDSYSAAHTRRDGPSGCIVKLKAYMQRDPGFLTDDIEFHGGGDEDTVGHTTTKDSIYREGRDCHDPNSKAAVSRCLNVQATAARDATAEFLTMLGELVRARATTEAIDTALDGFIDRHLRLCAP